MTTPEKITIDDVEYIRADSATEITKGDYVIVRTYSAGVHAGYLESHQGTQVVLRNTRRIYKWHGAASLSELAGRGTSQPDKCKFPAAIDSITLTEAIEIIPCTAKAQALIEGVKPWTA